MNETSDEIVHTIQNNVTDKTLAQEKHMFTMSNKQFPLAEDDGMELMAREYLSPRRSPDDKKKSPIMTSTAQVSSGKIYAQGRPHNSAIASTRFLSFMQNFYGSQINHDAKKIACMSLHSLLREALESGLHRKHSHSHVAVALMPATHGEAAPPRFPCLKG